jgi:4-hydroxy-tetrahydrodipicolinate synthase
MQDYRAIVDRIKGPLVPIIPAFSRDEVLDVDATCKWLNWEIEQGIGLFWLTGSSRYFSLTDEEVFDLTKAVAEVAKGRALLIGATNFHWPIHMCRRYLEHAARHGAEIVTLHMLYGDNDDRIFEFYKAVAEGSPLPLFAYTIPGSNSITPKLLNRILDLPQFVGMKNDAGDFYEHRAFLWTIKQHGARFTPMTGGSMMSFLFGYEFGAQAFTAAYGIAAPSIPLQFYKHLVEGRRDEALQIVKDYEEPMLTAFEDIGGWAALKATMVFRGFYETWQERFPVRTLTDADAQRVKAHLEGQGLL